MTASQRMEVSTQMASTVRRGAREEQFSLLSPPKDYNLLVGSPLCGSELKAPMKPTSDKYDIYTCNEFSLTISKLIF